MLPSDLLVITAGLPRPTQCWGTRWDPFGRTEERRTERRLIADYEATVSALLDTLNADSHALAVEVAMVPDQIRGFGHVKQRSIERAKEAEATLLQRLQSPMAAPAAAE